MRQDLDNVIAEKTEQVERGRRDRGDPAFFRKKVGAGFLLRDLELLGVALFAHRKDVEAFRRNLSESAALRLEYFERSGRGEEIDLSRISLLSYQSVYDALAAQAWEIAIGLSRRMRERENLRDASVQPVDNHMARTLIAFVLRDARMSAQRTLEFREFCMTKRDGKLFMGYAAAFQSVLDCREAALNVAFDQIVEAHSTLAGPRGRLSLTPHALMCLWGLGLANLARWEYGLRVDPIGAWVPEPLLAPVRKASEAG